MSIIRWNKNNEFFPNLLGEIFNENVFEKAIHRVSIPAVNLIENDVAFEIHMAAPGLKKEDFKIELDKDVLTISSKRSSKSEESSDTFTRKEYNYESFSRAFTLPENADTNRIDATYENGELRLSLPKKEDKTHKPREIAIS